MPAFEGLAHYQPALVLLLGVVTFASVLGVGYATLRALRLRIPSPWREVAAALLGTGMLSLGVQVLAMLALATRPALLLLWSGFALLGSIELWLRARGLELRRPELRGRGVPFLVGILGVAAAINLLLAMAPLTKIDEIFYQVLPPARIVLDGELVFYLRPWESAVVPQAGYPIAGAPLHAMGYVDAPSVWSWCLGALLTWFVARLVHEETGSGFTALLGAASVQVGLYPSVYMNTGGPHALGDLATAAAVLALLFREKLLRSCTPVAYVALISICSAMAASTKISLLPIAGIMLVLGLAQELHASRVGWLRISVAAAIPWLVFYVPLCLWTLIQSGSPFGPIMAGVLAPSVFDAAVQAEITGVRDQYRGGVAAPIPAYLIHYPLVYLVSLLAILVLPAAVPVRRIAVAALFLLQVLIVAILMPHNARYLSGLHYAALVVGLIALSPYVERWLTRALVPVAIAVVLLVPWLGAQAYRAWPLAPIALGIGEREEYYRTYIALYDDFRELDRILPADAVLYARNRLPSIYFPRPVYMHHRDLPTDRPAFVLLGTSERPIEAYDCAYLRLQSDCRLGDPVYTNPVARYMAFRTPGGEPLTNRLEVREILRAVR